MPDTQPSRAQVAFAFASLYLLWGSTYLAIRYAIETLPPFLMAGTRFIFAGTVLIAWSRWRGAPAPTGPNWAASTLVGALLLLGGNGGVVWAEQFVPSGVTALCIATTPLWMVLLDWFSRGGPRPGAGLLLGLLLGFGGLALLVGPAQIAGSAPVDPWGALVLVLASVSWATGSVFSRRLPLPASSLLAAGMEMLTGGALLCLAGLARGEAAALSSLQPSARSLVAVAYLIVFGSLVGFTAFAWLLRVSTPARVSTYAYVNPVVAVFLGWAIADEPIGPRTLLAAAVIVAAVALILWQRARAAPADPAEAAGKA